MPQNQSLATKINSTFMPTASTTTTTNLEAVRSVLLERDVFLRSLNIEGSSNSASSWRCFAASNVLSKVKACSRKCSAKQANAL